MSVLYPIQSDAVRKLSKLIEESTRATGESVKYFIEPTPGVLDKAKNKRHHIIFGRRGSGKSSLLHKVASDLTVSRTPIAYVDLEQFKGHSYPDVLISVLISTLTEFKKWLDTAATNPATKTSFWKRLFGSIPTKGAFPRRETLALSEQFKEMISELNNLRFQANETKQKERKQTDGSTETKVSSSLESSSLPVVKANIAGSLTSKEGKATELQLEYTSQKIEALHRNIPRYKRMFEGLATLADGPSFLLLDDLYHLRLSDQPQIIDYFFELRRARIFGLKSERYATDLGGMCEATPLPA
jgi:AAA+ ATPase superfamily predicted ATPase